MEHEDEFPIFINRRELRAPAEEMTGREILALAVLSADHDLFRLTGEGDRTGGTPVGLDETIRVHPGEHFRAIPGNRNFG